jgi:hypothetical protein
MSFEDRTMAVPARSWSEGMKTSGSACKGRTNEVIGNPSSFVWPLPITAVFVGTHVSRNPRKSVEHTITSAMPPAA